MIGRLSPSFSPFSAESKAYYVGGKDVRFLFDELRKEPVDLFQKTAWLGSFFFSLPLLISVFLTAFVSFPCPCCFHFFLFWSFLLWSLVSFSSIGNVNLKETKDAAQQLGVEKLFSLTLVFLLHYYLTKSVYIIHRSA